MKTLNIITIGIMFFLTSVNAQVSVNVNVGSPPLWGPKGYNDVQYYYIPDIESYYDVPSAMFIYLEGGAWVRRAYLPKRHHNYNLYNGYKVVLTDYQGHSPYDNHNSYKIKYKKGYKGGFQKANGFKSGNENAKINNSQKKIDNKYNTQPNHKQKNSNGVGKGKEKKSK